MLDHSKRLKQRFMDGVSEFVSTTMNQPSYIEDGGIRCPCVRCICQKILKPSHVRAYLLQYGFQPNYHVWVYHGEDRPTDDSIVYASTSYENMNYGANFGSITEMVYNAYMQVVDITTHYKNVQSEEMNRGEPPNAEAQKFNDMLASANEPVYNEATKSRLSVAIRLLASITNWHTIEKCLDYFIQLLLNISPRKNSILKNYYEAEKVVSCLGLKSVNIDCCQGGFMLYYKDDSELTECKFCGLPRYMPVKGQNKRYKKVPVKRMFYLPIIPRL